MLTAGQLSAFLKSDQAKMPIMAQQATDAMKGIEDALKKTQAQGAEQAQALIPFAVVSVVFTPLTFCTSVFYLLSAI